jgi:hypothetical protein
MFRRNPLPSSSGSKRKPSTQEGQNMLLFSPSSSSKISPSLYGTWRFHPLWRHRLMETLTSSTILLNRLCLKHAVTAFSSHGDIDLYLINNGLFSKFCLEISLNTRGFCSIRLVIKVRHSLRHASHTECSSLVPSSRSFQECVSPCRLASNLLRGLTWRKWILYRGPLWGVPDFCFHCCNYIRPYTQLTEHRIISDPLKLIFFNSISIAELIRHGEYSQSTQTYCALQHQV